MVLRYTLIFSILLNIVLISHSQVNRSLLSIHLGYGLYNTSSDLALRYGSNSGMTVAVEKTFNKGLSIASEYQLNFGSKVKEDVLAPYRNENGFVIGINGIGSNSFLRMRSNYLGLLIGQTLNNNGRGLKINVGGGLFSHYIRIVDDSRNLAIADNPYRKGFDRLTNGIAAKQELLYEYHGQDNNYHFNVGFSIIEGFTSPVRSINFDTGMPSPSERLDILYGIKLLWMIPLIKGSSEDVKYY